MNPKTFYRFPKKLSTEHYCLERRTDRGKLIYEVFDIESEESLGSLRIEGDGIKRVVSEYSSWENNTFPSVKEEVEPMVRKLEF